MNEEKDEAPETLVPVFECASMQLTIHLHKCFKNLEVQTHTTVVVVEDPETTQFGDVIEALLLLPNLAYPFKVHRVRCHLAENGAEDSNSTQSGGELQTQFTAVYTAVLATVKTRTLNVSDLVKVATST